MSFLWTVLRVTFLVTFVSDTSGTIGLASSVSVVLCEGLSMCASESEAKDMDSSSDGISCCEEQNHAKVEQVN